MERKVLHLLPAPSPPGTLQQASGNSRNRAPRDNFLFHQFLAVWHQGSDKDIFLSLGLAPHIDNLIVGLLSHRQKYWCLRGERCQGLGRTGWCCTHPGCLFSQHHLQCWCHQAGRKVAEAIPGCKSPMAFQRGEQTLFLTKETSSSLLEIFSGFIQLCVVLYQPLW